MIDAVFIHLKLDDVFTAHDRGVEKVTQTCDGGHSQKDISQNRQVFKHLFGAPPYIVRDVHNGKKTKEYKE